MPNPSDKSPQSGAVEATELILRGSVARIPIALRGVMGKTGLEELSGSVAIDKSLSALLADLGPGFGDAVGLLEQLVGENASIALQGLAFGYNTAEQQKFAQVAVTMTAGASSCDFVVIKGLDKSGGFIAGLDLHSDKTPLHSNPLRGLIGEVAIGGLGIYYASRPFKSLRYRPLDAVQNAASLMPKTLDIRGRDFAQGVSFSAQILVGGVDLLDALRTAVDAKPAAEPTPSPPPRRPRRRRRLHRSPNRRCGST